MFGLSLYASWVTTAQWHPTQPKTNIDQEIFCQMYRAINECLIADLPCPTGKI